VLHDEISLHFTPCHDISSALSTIFDEISPCGIFCSHSPFSYSHVNVRDWQSIKLKCATIEKKVPWTSEEKGKIENHHKNQFFSHVIRPPPIFYVIVCM
jgi:hypothetical protein